MEKNETDNVLNSCLNINCATQILTYNPNSANIAKTIVYSHHLLTDQFIFIEYIYKKYNNRMSADH